MLKCLIVLVDEHQEVSIAIDTLSVEFTESLVSLVNILLPLHVLLEQILRIIDVLLELNVVK
jgi:hypothetical protein